VSASSVTWNQGVMSSIRSDWSTPRHFFSALSREFNFELDACATDKTAMCERFYTEGALEKSWSVSAGRSIWMNPPYGREIASWIHKALMESKRGQTVVCLLPARTDTSWFHEYCTKGEIRFVRGRLCFDDNPRMRAPFPSMVVIFRAATPR
jgi:phage N-6-adenine-methyltransferase